jgi:SagB-type dehydrogenase family enzyme
MSVAAEYAEAIVRRAREPMEPIDFEPDWADQPLRHKSYPGALRLPLPSGSPSASVGLGDCLSATTPAGAGFTLESMAAMLRHSYGLLARRLRVNGNQDNDGRPWYRGATYSRGTASGGGLYPCEVYWVSGPGGPVLPGVYHYSTPHHAMDRLLTGDVVDRVRAAVPGYAQAERTDQFLLVSVKFWKNAFKYNSFCYHVVTMDTGCLLGTWQLWSRMEGAPVRPALWFDEPALGDLLGLDTSAESVLAVVPLPWRDRPLSVHTGGSTVGGAPRVGRAEYERSRTVIRFPRIEEVHAATLAAPLPRPEPRRLAEAEVRPPAASPTLALPPTDQVALGTDLVDALRRRRSSFGLFRARPALTATELATVLATAGPGSALRVDVRGDDGSPALTRLAVFVNHVEGVAEGAYDYQPDHHALRLIPGERNTPFLQHQYFLNNYNLEQAGAVLAVISRPRAAVEAIGDRAYRLVNAEVGAVAQTLYLVAAALGIGCGAALGFDNVALAERLGIAGTDEWPVLIIMLGRERGDQADIAYRLS